MLKTLTLCIVLFLTLPLQAQPGWEAWKTRDVLWELDTNSLETNPRSGFITAWLMATPPKRADRPAFYVMQVIIDCGTSRYTIRQMRGFYRGTDREQPIDVPRGGLKSPKPGSAFGEAIDRVCD